MPTAKTGTSLTANGIDLVDKDDRRGYLLGLFKQVTHTAGTNTHVQFNKVRTGNGKELHIGLPCHRFGKQRFTRTRRAYEENAFRNPSTHISITLRIFQEVNHFSKFGFFFVTAGNVLKRLFVFLIGTEPGTRLAETSKAARSAASGTVHHEIPEAHGTKHDNQVRDKACPPGKRKAFGIIILFDDAGFVLFQNQIMKVFIKNGKTVEIVGFFFRLIGITRPDLQNNGVSFRFERLDFFLFKKINELGIGVKLIFPGIGIDGIDDGYDNNGKKHIKTDVSGFVAVRFQKRITSFGSGKNNAMEKGIVSGQE